MISHFVNDHVDQCLKGAIPTPLIEQPNSPSCLESGNAELPDQSTLIDFVESVNGAESESLEYTQEVQINIQTDNSIPIDGQECGSDPTTGNQHAILLDDANLEGGKNDIIAEEPNPDLSTRDEEEKNKAERDASGSMTSSLQMELTCPVCLSIFINPVCFLFPPCI